MNIQERIEALETEFNEKIKALKAEAQREDEFPQGGDLYWIIEDSTEVSRYAWKGDDFDNQHLPVGNVFRTKEQAEFAAEKLKVEAELRKFSVPFEPMVDNFYMVLDLSDGDIGFWSMVYSKAQGAIYFESKKTAIEAIQSVGKERIKKYIFGVED